MPRLGLSPVPNICAIFPGAIGNISGLPDGAALGLRREIYYPEVDAVKPRAGVYDDGVTTRDVCQYYV